MQRRFNSALNYSMHQSFGEIELKFIKGASDSHNIKGIV